MINQIDFNEVATFPHLQENDFLGSYKDTPSLYEETGIVDMGKVRPSFSDPEKVFGAMFTRNHLPLGMKLKTDRSNLGFSRVEKYDRYLFHNEPFNLKELIERRNRPVFKANIKEIVRKKALPFIRDVDSIPNNIVLEKSALKASSSGFKPKKNIVNKPSLFHTFKAIIPNGRGSLKISNSVKAASISALQSLGSGGGMKVVLDEKVSGYTRLGEKTSWSVRGRNVVVGDYKKNDVKRNTIFLLVDNQVITGEVTMYGEISVKTRDGDILSTKKSGNFFTSAREKRDDGSGGYVLMTTLEPGDSVKILTAAPKGRQEEYFYENQAGRLIRF